MVVRTSYRGKWLVPTLLALYALGFVWGCRHFLLGGAPLGDDHSAHLALSVQIAKLISQGHSDFFWGHSNLGLPLFASYQPIPSMLTGLAIVSIPFIDPILLFKVLVVSLWATLPMTWYLGSRWLGMERSQALILGLITLTVRSEWHIGLTLTSSAYTGLYTQSWGLWLMPLTVGVFYRVFYQRNLAWHWAPIVLSLTLMSHLFTGLLTGIACACIGLVRWSNTRPILPSIGAHLVVTFAICAFSARALAICA